MPKLKESFDKEKLTQSWAETYRDDFGDQDVPQYELKMCTIPLIVKEDKVNNKFL